MQKNKRIILFYVILQKKSNKLIKDLKTHIKWQLYFKFSFNYFNFKVLVILLMIY